MMARLPGVNKRAPDALDDAGDDQQGPPFGARPQRAEATANQAIPMENTRLRPKRSPSDPPSSKKAASVSE